MISTQAKRIVLASTVLACFSVSAVFATETATEATAAADKTVAKTAGLTEQVSALAGKMVNINTADASTLAAIPGIGETLAQAITKYREMNGSFSQIKDLLNVEGINAELLEKIAPFLKF